MNPIDQWTSELSAPAASGPSRSSVPPGTLAAITTSTPITAAQMAAVVPTKPRPTRSEREWSLEAAMEPLPELPPQPSQRRAWVAAATQLPAFTSSRRRSRRAVAVAVLLGALLAGAGTILLVRALQRPVAMTP